MASGFIMATGMCQIMVFVIVCGGLIQARHPHQDNSGTHDQTSKKDPKSKRSLIHLCESFIPILNGSVPGRLFITIKFNNHCENLSILFQSMRFSVILKNGEFERSHYLRSIRCNCKSEKPCERSYNVQGLTKEEHGYDVIVRLACSRVCDSCLGIQYRVPARRKTTTVVTAFSASPVIVTTDKPNHEDNNITKHILVAFGFWIFVAFSSCTCLLVYWKLHRNRSDEHESFDGNYHQLSNPMHTYNKKKIIFVDFPFKEFNILLDILNQFEMLDVVDISACHNDIQANYERWVRNIQRVYNGIVIVVTRQFNEAIPEHVDKSQNQTQAVDPYTPVITRLIQHLDEKVGTDFEKYVVTCDSSSNLQDFLNRFPTFKNGKCFSLVSLNEHSVNSTLEKDSSLLKYLISSMLNNINIQDKDGIINTSLRNIDMKCLEYEL